MKKSEFMLERNRNGTKVTAIEGASSINEAITVVGGRADDNGATMVN